MNGLFGSVFEFIGVITIIAVVLSALAVFYEFIKDEIRDLKWEYKRKHRFDKPPTAECYCKDCIYYAVNEVNGAGSCKIGHIDKAWNIADSWFCWKATPYKKDPEN